MCERGLIRMRYLHDRGGRRDLRQCARAHTPPLTPQVLAEVLDSTHLTPKQYSRPYRRRQALNRVFPIREQIEARRLQAGVFGQVGESSRHTSGGAFVGLHPTLPRGRSTSLSFGLPGAGLELLARPLVVAPKVWLEASFVLVGLRADLTYYRYHNQNDLRLTPQVGLTLAGLVNLFYGQNIPLTPERLDQLGRHRITLFVNFM